MIIRLTLLFSLFLFFGCSPSVQSTPPNAYPAYESPAETLIIEYESLFRVSVDFPVYIDNTSTGVTREGYKILGLCILEGNGRRSVYLNQTWWEAKDDSDRRVLLFHELTHCVFNRGHDDRKYPISGMPYSIMSSVINPVLRFFKKHDRYYLNEVVNPQAGTPMIPSEASTFITTEENCLLKE